MSMVRRKVQRGAVLLTALIFSIALSAAQNLSHFHQYPDARVALSESLKARRFCEQTNALAWARAQGVPVRETRNGRVRELWAVRDGKPIYVTTMCVNAAISTGANLVRDNTDFGVDGSGVHVGIWDEGLVLSNHVEFGSRVTLMDDADAGDHGTHVGGIIGAAGVRSTAKGMAPGVWIDTYDWTSDLDELTDAGADEAGQEDALYLSNHSYGYGITDSSTYYLFGLYTSDVRDMDRALAGLEYCLPVIAAGNEQSYSSDGYDTLTMYAVSKNTLTVGSVNDAVSGGVRTLSSAALSSFSSCGPADDGRIKPDIMANGYAVYSAVSTATTGYSTYSGSSMAAPNACGSAVLLVDYYKSLTDGGAMHASTLKGLIIHTADDLGRSGPDYQYGWGLMNTLAAAALIRDVTSGETDRMIESTLSESSMSQSRTIYSSGSSPLRVTLCWTDQPGLSDGTSDDDRDADLVNDLDLKVIAPDGTVYYPYSLSYSYPTANATTNAENELDNVEQVYIANPQAGTYTITVDCDEALRYYSDVTVRRPGGGGLPSGGSLVEGGTQSYSLIVSGLFSDSDGDGLPNDWEVLYFEDETNAVASADDDGDGASNLEEYVAGTDPMDSSSRFVSTGTETEAGWVLSWEPAEGRVYQIGWTTNLLTTPFAPIETGLYYPAGSFTDSVYRAENQQYYRVGVELVP